MCGYNPFCILCTSCQLNQHLQDSLCQQLLQLDEVSILSPPASICEREEEEEEDGDMEQQVFCYLHLQLFVGVLLVWIKMLYSCIFLFYLKQCIFTRVPGELIFLNLPTLRRWALMLFIISSFLGWEAAVLLCVAPSSSSGKVSGIHFLSALPNIREAVQRNTGYCYSPAQQGDETNT